MIARVGRGGTFGARVSPFFRNKNMTVKRELALWAVMGVVTSLVCGSALPDSKASTKDAMKRKLEHSQNALEGMTMEKFDLLEQNAAALVRLSQTAAWRAIETDEYRLFSDEFRRHAKALQTAAQKKNIDAASLAYVQMTLTCINCHKYVRNKQKSAAL